MKNLIIAGIVISSSLYALDYNSIPQEYKEQIQNHFRWRFMHHYDKDRVKTEFTNNTDKCFNVSDIEDSDNASITTKIAGKKFYLKIIKKPECNVNSLTYELIDNTTGEVIANTTHTIVTNIPNENLYYIDYNITNSYKDVTVKLSYESEIPAETCSATGGYAGISVDVNTPDIVPVDGHFKFKAQFGTHEKCYDFTKYKHHHIKFHIFPHKINCKSSCGWKFNINDISIDSKSCFKIPTTFKCYDVSLSMFGGLKFDNINCPANPIEAAGYLFKENKKNISTSLVKNGDVLVAIPEVSECYENEATPSVEKSEYTVDNFAIRPDKFNIAFSKTNVSTNELIPFSISAVRSDGIVTDNYSASSTDLKVSFSNPDTYPKYSFDIINGTDSKGSLYLTKAGTTDMNVTDENFAKVDEDDTTDEQRYIIGSSTTSSSSEVTATDSKSKYWAGVGTNEEQNDPTKNTIQTDVKQNVKKDLHFNNVNW